MVPKFDDERDDERHIRCRMTPADSCVWFWSDVARIRIIVLLLRYYYQSVYRTLSFSVFIGQDTRVDHYEC